MDAIFKLFNIPTDEITEVARNTDSIIAGSAPLCALVGGKWEPNDLDIWYYDNYDNDGADEPSDARYDKFKRTVELYTELLAKCGYKLCDRPDGKDEEECEDYSNLTYKFSDIVKRVYKFYNSESKKSVQLIITYAPVVKAVYCFDLSCCATWWDPKSEDSSKMLKTLDSEATLSNTMYSITDKPTDREKGRIEKYKARGFTLVSAPSK